MGAQAALQAVAPDFQHAFFVHLNSLFEVSVYLLLNGSSQTYSMSEVVRGDIEEGNGPGSCCL